MKKILALLAVVLGVVSCQTEPEGLDVNVGGEQEVAICVSLPETTRANSALGAFDNVDFSGDKTIRYILKIYQKVGDNYVASTDRQVEYSDGKSVVFPVRLVPNRDYRFVVWADYVVSKNDADYHYNTADLTNITLKEGTWVAMDETRDAFTGVYCTVEAGKKYTSTSSINIELKRPFAKLRVITTDMKELGHLGINPTHATVEYKTEYRAGFNALESVALPAGSEKKSHSTVFEIKNYDDVSGANKVLFTDYFFAEEGDAVSFILDVYEDQAKTKLIKSNDFSTDIAVNRNYLTTIQGNILTDGNNVTVTVEDAFENADNTTDEPYYHKTISSAAEFYAALNKAGEYTVISDIDITSSAIETRTTGAPAEGKVTTINLNGKTITVTNKTGEPFATVAAGNTLFLEGGNIVLAEGSTASFIDNQGNVVLTNGTLENKSNDNTAAVVEGKVIVEENATVNDNNTTQVTNWLADVLANGGTYLFTEDMKAGQIKVTATAPVVLDGNGYTFTYTGSERAIEIPKEATRANVTIKNLNIALKASYCERGINFNVTDGTLTIDNVKVSETGTAATYAINLPGFSDNATVVINNSYLRGNIALNVWGKDVEITATDTEFVSYDGTEVENYAAISLNSDGATNIADGTVVTIEGGKIIALDENGENSNAIRNSTNSGIVTVSESTEVIGIRYEPVAIVTYAGYDQFYSCPTLQQAINKAAENSNATAKLIKDITLDKPVMVAEDQTIVLDLNGKTLAGTMAKSVGHVVKNEGTLTVKNGTISSTGANGGSALYNAGTLTVENAIINGSSIFDNGGWPSYPINNYGPVMTVKNSTINGYQGAVACNVPGTTTMENCTINKHYSDTSSHVFYINHADAKVIVNGGTYTHKGMDGSLAYVNKGEITVNDGTFNAENGGYGIAALSGGRVVVTGGTFNAGFLGWGGTIEITGGTFKAEPKNYLAEGYKAIAVDGKYMVVAENVKGYVNSVITNQEGVLYQGDFFASGYAENALWFNNYIFGGDAAIMVVDKTYGAIIMENCSGNFKNDVFTIDNDNNSVMCLQNLDFTLAEGKKLIKSEKTIHQVFMANITINGEKMTQETIGKYLENVEWYQVVEEI